MLRAFTTGAALIAMTAPGVAGDWQSQNIDDHLKGRIGVGTTVGGMLVGGDRGSNIGLLRAYCAENQTVVNIYSDKVYFGSSSGVPVRYVLDGGPVQRAQWSTCVNSRCVGLWSGQGIPFLKSLYGKRELKVVIELSFTAPVNATFNVDGAEGALAEVGEACGWIPKAATKKQ